MSKKLDEILKKIKQIESSSMRDLFKGLANDGKDLDNILGLVNNTLEQQSKGLEDVAGRYRDIVDLNSKQAEKSQQILSTTNDLVSISRSLSNIKKGESSTSKQELKSLASQIQSKKSILVLQQGIVGSSSEQGKIISSVLKSLDDELSQLKAVQENFSAVNKELGFGPAILGGMDKALSKLGLPDLGISKALEDTQKMGMAAKNTGGEFNAMTEFSKNLGKQMMKSLSFANLLQMSLLATFKAIKAGDKAIGEMAKDMNITYNEAAALRTELSGIAKESGDPALNTERLQKSMMAVNKLMGARVNMSKEDLKLFTKLREQAGYTNEELFGIQQLATLNNKSFKQTNKELLGSAKAFAAQNKVAINEKQILNDIVKSSTALQLSLGGSTKELAKAAVTARKFGVSLEQSEKMADSLLDFESSITKELEAELLTGKNLNFEKARGLALQGKTAEAAALMLEQMGGSAEFAKMNVIQQKAMAEAAGMTRDEFAKSIKDREVLEKLGAEEGQSQLEAYQTLRKTMTAEEARVQLGDDALQKQLEQQSNQEKFQQAVMKMQEAFTELANKLMPVFTMLADLGQIIIPLISIALLPVQYALDGIKMVVEGVSNLFSGELMTGVDYFGVALAGISAIFTAISAKQLIMNTRAKIGNAIALARNAIESKGLGTMLGNAAGSIYKGLGMVPFGLGIPLAIAAVSGMVASITGLTKMKDGVIGPGGETVVSGPKGSVQLDKEDSMIVGTDLGGKKKSKSQSPTPQISMASTNAKLDAILAAIEKGSIIEMNGDKMGETINQGTRAIQ